MMLKKKQTLREQELMYARLDGKHTRLTETSKRCNGFFWVYMNQIHGGDSEYWMKFMTGYNNPYKKVKLK
jgi:hypothetical protein